MTPIGHPLTSKCAAHPINSKKKKKKKSEVIFSEKRKFHSNLRLQTLPETKPTKQKRILWRKETSHPQEMAQIFKAKPCTMQNKLVWGHSNGESLT